MKMKRVLLTIRDLVIAQILYMLPLAIGMAVNLALKGNFEFTFKHLTMVLFGIGGILTVCVFKKWGDVEMPKERKAPAMLYVWYSLFGGMLALLPIVFLLHGAEDDEIKINLAKQIEAVFFAPFAEEILCRYLMTHIIKRGSNTKAMCIFTAVMTSLLWTLPHCYAAFTSARVLISGIIASMVYQKTGSLKLCIFSHAANNICVTLVMLFGRAYTSPLPLAITIIASVIITAGFVYEMAKLFRKDKNDEKPEIRVVPIMQ